MQKSPRKPYIKNCVVSNIFQNTKLHTFQREILFAAKEKGLFKSLKGNNKRKQHIASCN